MPNIETGDWLGVVLLFGLLFALLHAGEERCGFGNTPVECAEEAQ